MEIWELTNERGEPQGVYYDRSLGEPIPDGYYFQVAEVWVVVDGRILVTRRHPDKWAGLMWEVPGGGVLRGESPICAASRELGEEVGISAPVSELIPLEVTTHGNALVYSFLTRLKYTPVLRLQPTEVVDYRLLLPDELDSLTGEMTVGTVERLPHVIEKLSRLGWI